MSQISTISRLLLRQHLFQYLRTDIPITIKVWIAWFQKTDDVINIVCIPQKTPFYVYYYDITVFLIEKLLTVH